MTIAGFSACNRTEVEPGAANVPGEEEQVVGMEQDAQVDESEQAVRGEEWEQDQAAPGARTTGAANEADGQQDPQMSADVRNIQNMQTGQSLSHYIDRFQQMGWRLEEAQRDGEEMTLTLEKFQAQGQTTAQGQQQGQQDEQLDVVLTIPEQGQQVVRSIEVDQGLWGNQATTNTSSNR